jgi:hypothetical protein
MPQDESGPDDVQSSEPQRTQSGDGAHGNSTLLARYKLAEQASLDDRLGRRDIAVLFVILGHMSKRSGEAFPGVDRIAGFANVDRTTATRSIKRLVELGYLARSKGKGRLANSYHLPARSTCKSAPTSEDRSTCSPAPTSDRSRCKSGHVVGANSYIEGDRLLISSNPLKEEPDVEIAREAIEKFNAILGKPNGMLPPVVEGVGFSTKVKQVKHALSTASEICRHYFDSPLVTSEFWATYFASVKEDKFLSGRSPPKNGSDWTPTFDYLVRPETMLKVYERESAKQ